MEKLPVKGIQDLAAEILAERPDGMRYGELVKTIHGKAPSTPINTIHGAIVRLVSVRNDVAKPSKGLFKHVKHMGEKSHVEIRADSQNAKSKPKLKEDDVYSPFAAWLRDEMDEASETAVIGGSGFKNKWGTPDVIGVYKPKKSDLFKFSPEIVSAEIKTDALQAIVAFGQAVSYRLFSHKTYIVMSDAMTEEDSSRIEALGMLFGIGFVTFSKNGDDFSFSVRLRAQKAIPDMFYVNEFVRRFHEINPDDFERLF